MIPHVWDRLRWLHSFTSILASALHWWGVLCNVFKYKLRSRYREAAATKFPGSGLTWAYCSLRNKMEQNEMKINRNENLQFAKWPSTVWGSIHACLYYNCWLRSVASGSFAASATNSRLDLPALANHVIRPKTTRLETSLREEQLHYSLYAIEISRS